MPVKLQTLEIYILTLSSFLLLNWVPAMPVPQVSFISSSPFMPRNASKTSNRDKFLSFLAIFSTADLIKITWWHLWKKNFPSHLHLRFHLHYHCRPPGWSLSWGAWPFLMAEKKSRKRWEEIFSWIQRVNSGRRRVAMLKAHFFQGGTKSVCVYVFI